MPGPAAPKQVNQRPPQQQSCSALNLAYWGACKDAAQNWGQNQLRQHSNDLRNVAKGAEAVAGVASAVGTGCAIVGAITSETIVGGIAGASCAAAAFTVAGVALVANLGPKPEAPTSSNVELALNALGAIPGAGIVARGARVAKPAEEVGSTVARITPGSLPAAEETAVLDTLSHIDAGTKPAGALAKKWGAAFKNWNNDLPGASEAASPYREYRVAPPPGTAGAGPLRIVQNPQSGDTYYTWTHYGDTGDPAFVQIR